ncbi:hypothetical protein [Gemella cuniculi]|uniref:hypothetical protein n=1 Tax=Gemella cuniculi TaxID=150240 RepID=UPI00041FD286|nr:hypothetical protein [Gemella cuniculi]
MKHDDFDLDLKRVSTNDSDVQARARTIITTTIVLSALNKCTSAVNPTGGMTQGCCHKNLRGLEAEEKLRCQ